MQKNKRNIKRLGLSATSRETGNVEYYFRRPPTGTMRITGVTKGERALLIGKNPPSAGMDLDSDTQECIDSMCRKNNISDVVIMNLIPCVVPYGGLKKEHSDRHVGNEDMILKEAKLAKLTIIAWGTNDKIRQSKCDIAMLSKLRDSGIDLYCIRERESDCPLHILTWKKAASLTLVKI